MRHVLNNKAKIMRILTSIFFVIFLAGCATVGPPGGYDEIAVRDQKKSIVLFRFSGNMAGTPVSEDDFFIELADIDRYEIPRKYHVKSFPSPETRKNGWAYILLEPGTYYFTVTPGYASQDAGPESLDADTGKIERDVFGRITKLTTFWFNLPRGVPVTYIGTFSFSCALTGDRGGSDLICSDVDVYDESVIAGEITGSSFGQYGAIVTNILKKYGVCDKREAVKLRPFGTTVSSRISFDPFELIQISSDRVAGPGYGYLSGIPPGMPFSTLFYPDGFLYGYRPYGSGLGIGIYFDNSFWPCFDKIADEIANSNLTGILENLSAIINSLDSAKVLTQRNGSETNGGNRGLLQIVIQRAHLSECNETWTFCTEIEVRSRLFDPSTGKYACDSVLQYSNLKQGRPRGQGRYVLPVRKVSPCLYLDDWCGSEGSALLQGQFAEAMKSISDKIMNDLGY